MPDKKMEDKKILFWGLASAIFVAIVLSLFASSHPDGLEKIAERKGFLEVGEVAPIFSSPMPDYLSPGIKSEKLATSFAGFIGTIIVFGIGYGLANLIRKR